MSKRQTSYYAPWITNTIHIVFFTLLQVIITSKFGIQFFDSLSWKHLNVEHWHHLNDVWELTKKILEKLWMWSTSRVTFEFNICFFWILVEFPYSPCIFTLFNSCAIICLTHNVEWAFRNAPTPVLSIIYDKFLLFPRARIDWVRCNRYGILKLTRWLVFSKLSTLITHSVTFSISILIEAMAYDHSKEHLNALEKKFTRISFKLLNSKPFSVMDTENPRFGGAVPGSITM